MKTKNFIHNKHEKMASAEMDNLWEERDYPVYGFIDPVKAEVEIKDALYGDKNSYFAEPVVTPNNLKYQQIARFVELMFPFNALFMLSRNAGEQSDGISGMEVR